MVFDAFNSDEIIISVSLKLPWTGSGVCTLDAMREKRSMLYDCLVSFW